jgi:hypothetical protein
MTTRVAAREASTTTPPISLLKPKERENNREPSTAMLERHFTPQELADPWGFSERFVRELFRNEEGVIIIDRPEQMHKRGYATMRIPESVASRVYARLTSRRRAA